MRREITNAEENIAQHQACRIRRLFKRGTKARYRPKIIQQRVLDGAPLIIRRHKRIQRAQTKACILTRRQKDIPLSMDRFDHVSERRFRQHRLIRRLIRYCSSNNNARFSIR